MRDISTINRLEQSRSTINRLEEELESTLKILRVALVRLESLGITELNPRQKTPALSWVGSENGNKNYTWGWIN